MAKRKSPAPKKKPRPAPPPPVADPPAGGRGEEPYLTPVQEHKIISRLLHFDREIWPVNDEQRGYAVEATHKLMSHEDGRVVNGAVRNLITMVGQNVDQAKQDAGGDKGNATNVQVNVYIPDNTRDSATAGTTRILPDQPG